jgi:hypothetical protein
VIDCWINGLSLTAKIEGQAKARIEKSTLSCHVYGMSKEELKEFLAAMERVRAANTASPEKARQFLKEEGYLTENGDIAEPYSSASQVLKP